MKTYTLTSKDDTFIDSRGEGQTKDKKWYVELSGDDLTVSDGYHTMEELYDHRRALTSALCSTITVAIGAMPELICEIQIMKSKLHNDGTMFDGYFIVLIIFKGEQISYHYSLEYWDDFDIPEVERIPFEYDGHTSQDVIERLLKL